MWSWWLHILIPAHISAPLIHSERMVNRAYRWPWQGFPMDDCFRRLHFVSKIAGYPRHSAQYTAPDEVNRIILEFLTR
jgi:hypothetical protein